MYALKNKVQLIGNTGNAPEVKTLPSGKKLARFSIATSEAYKNDNGERVVDTQWHNIIAWGKVAELVEQLVKKGTEIAIEGKLTHNSYTDAQGIKRYNTEIVTNEFLLLNKKANA